MAKNDFKAFATGENANVLTQAEYEELAALPAGFSSGIARSEQLNKVWRQASTIAAVVSSFMADKSGDDVLDEGDISALKATLVKALLANSRTQLDDVYLQKARSLADLPNKLTARQNLELDKVGNFASVQQGGGIDQDINKVYIGWKKNGKLGVTVDSTDVGEFFTTSNPPTAAQSKALSLEGGSIGNRGLVSAGDIKANASNIITRGGAYYIQNSDGVNIAVISASSGGTIQLQPLAGRAVVNVQAELHEYNQRTYNPNNPPPYPVTSVNAKSGAVTITKSDVGLGNVANYTAIQQGGGFGQSANKVYLGWGSDGRLRFTVDNSDQGTIYSTNNPPPYPVTSVNGAVGAVSLRDGFSTDNIGMWWDSVLSSLRVQVGTFTLAANAAASVNIAFPKAFPNNCIIAIPVPDLSLGISPAATEQIGVSARTNATVTFTKGVGDSWARGGKYLAIGY